MRQDEQWVELDLAPYILVSNKGRFKNARTGALKQTSLNGNGYLYVAIWIDGKTRVCHAAKLVARMWLDGYSDKRRVQYHDGDPTNICVENLYSLPTLFEYKRDLPPTRRHANRVRIKELDKVFLTAEAAARHIGGYGTSIHACLRGEQRQHMGYTFELVTVQDMLEYQRRRDRYEG